MRFDPMTGQPIDDDADGFVQAGNFEGEDDLQNGQGTYYDPMAGQVMQGGFDPMTGKPIQGSYNTMAGQTMQGAFDPMTGEPIQGGYDPMTGEQIQGGYDPMTGEQIQGGYDPMTGEQITGYDPMTGEPIYGGYDPTTGQQITGYDPMTGEPIYGGFDPMTGQQITGYDPMTGEPIYGGFDPMTGQPISNNGKVGKVKKGGKGLKVVIAAAAVVVVAGVAITAVAKSGAFMSSSKKVLLATANTFTESNAIIDALKGTDVLLEDEFTMSMLMDIEGGSIEASLKKAQEQIQVSGVIAPPDFAGIDFIADMDGEAVRAQLTSLDDRVLTYYYTKEKTGFIADMAEDELEMIDEALSAVFTGDDNIEAFYKDISAAVLAEYDKLEFEKVDAEEFEINGKDVDCKGYMTEITEDTILDLLDSIEAVYEDYYTADMSYMFEEMEYTFEDMPDMEVTFYVYKNQLACIRLDVDGEEVDIAFLGGETRAQNIEVSYDGDTMMEVEGETSGSTETITLSVMDTEVMELEYDSKSGEYDFKFATDYESIRAKGTFVSEKNGITVSLDSFKIDDTSIDMDVNLSVTKGASFEKLKGEVFDIGEASESELEDLVMEYEDLLSDF